MNIVYIHGNGASSASFNFLRTQLVGHKEILIDYDSRDGFRHNYKAMLARLQEVEDIFFVAHSLGGIYALHLANEMPDQVLGAVTLSTPYGGSEAAKFAKYILPFNQVLMDIQPYSAPIFEAKQIQVQHPWINVVSTRGHSPLMTAANDGVVTQDSMRDRQDITLLEVDSNHFEIVLSHEAVAIIKTAIEQIEKERQSPAEPDRPRGRSSFASAVRSAYSYLQRQH